MRGSHRVEMPSAKTAPAEKAGGIGRCQALASLCKGMVGAGVLSLPLAFKQSGQWAGLVLMAVFGGVTFVTFRKMVVCSHHLTRKHGLARLDYGAMAESAFARSLPPVRRLAPFMRYYTNVCIFGMQLGICSVYVVFVRDHARELIDYQWPGNDVSTAAYDAVEFAFLAVLVLVSNLKLISLIALAGNVIMMAALIIIMQQLIRAEHHFEALPSVEGLNGIVLAAGSILYAFEGQAVILPLDNKMKRPHEMLGWNGVLTVGCSVVTTVYIIVGFFGFATYSTDTKASIALNVPNSGIFFYMKILLVIVVYLSYLIQQFVMVDMMWPAIREFIERRKLAPSLHLIWEYLFKVALVCISFALALSVPNLEDIIPLVGITAGMNLALILPALCHMMTFLPEWLNQRQYTKMIFHLIFDFALIISGTLFLITGLISNVKNIVKDY